MSKLALQRVRELQSSVEDARLEASTQAARIEALQAALEKERQAAAAAADLAARCDKLQHAVDQYRDSDAQLQDEIASLNDQKQSLNSRVVQLGGEVGALRDCACACRGWGWALLGQSVDRCWQRGGTRHGFMLALRTLRACQSNASPWGLLPHLCRWRACRSCWALRVTSATTPTRRWREPRRRAAPCARQAAGGSCETTRTQLLQNAS